MLKAEALFVRLFGKWIAQIEPVCQPDSNGAATHLEIKIVVGKFLGSSLLERIERTHDAVPFAHIAFHNHGSTWVPKGRNVQGAFAYWEVEANAQEGSGNRFVEVMNGMDAYEGARIGKCGGRHNRSGIVHDHIHGKAEHQVHIGFARFIQRQALVQGNWDGNGTGIGFELGKGKAFGFAGRVEGILLITILHSKVDHSLLIDAVLNIQTTGTEQAHFVLDIERAVLFPEKILGIICSHTQRRPNHQPFLGKGS